MTKKLVEAAQEVLTRSIWDENCDCAKCKAMRALEVQIILERERSSLEPLPCARCAAIDARTQALEQLPKADRSLPNDDVEGASRDASCEHDLQKPNHTVDVDGPYDAKCRVCKEEWHIPHPTPQRPGPADLVGALQDVVHTDPGPVRVGKAFREASSEKAVK